MELLLHEIAHLIISLLIGFSVWRIYKKPFPAFAAALLGGVLIDADHLFDYFLVFGPSFNIRYFFENIQFSISRKVYVPFHAWEYVILLSGLYIYLQNNLTKKKLKISKGLFALILSLTLSMYSHLIIDTMTNNLVLPGYSIIYRTLNNFSAEKISR